MAEQQTTTGQEQADELTDQDWLEILRVREKNDMNDFFAIEGRLHSLRQVRAFVDEQIRQEEESYQEQVVKLNELGDQIDKLEETLGQ